MTICWQIETFFRLGQLLNVLYEKTPENVLQRSVMRAAGDLGLTLVDFTSTEDVYFYGIRGKHVHVICSRIKSHCTTTHTSCYVSDTA